MDKIKLFKIEELISQKKISEAEFEISKLGEEYFKSPDYLYLRSKILYINKLYYLSLDALLIALEFGENDKIYELISKIYGILGNKDLSEKISKTNLRINAIKSLKEELRGISQKE